MNHNLAFAGLLLLTTWFGFAQAVCSPWQAFFGNSTSTTWANATAVSAAGAPFATSSGVFSGDLIAYFGNSISNISGIAVSIQRKCSVPGTCYDSEIKIMGGMNKADSAYWDSNYETISYGNCTDTWGISSFPSTLQLIVSANASTTATFTIDYINVTIYYTGDLTSGVISTGEQTTSLVTSGIVTSGEVTTGVPPVTSGLNPLTTGLASPLTSGSTPAVTSGSALAVTSGVSPAATTYRVTSGQASITSGNAGVDVTTASLSGINDTSNILTTTGEEKSSSDAIDFPLLYIILGSVIGVLFIAIVVLLGVYVKKRQRASYHDEIRPKTDVEIEEIQKKELPVPEEKDLVIPITKMGDKIEELKKPVDYPNANGFDVEFNYIEKKTEHQVHTEDYASASLPINAAKNRFRNVLPPEETRVKLVPVTGIDGSDYINANYIKGLIPSSEKAYIATQGPLASTINDFWRMVWEQNTVVILNLTREFENGRLKSERYWPENEEPFDTPDFEINLGSIKEAEGLVVRKLSLLKKETKETREITQFHYIGWPDHGIPTHTDAYIQLAEGADTANTTNAPVVVHCSAGIGRTGTFVTIHSILELVKLHLKQNPGQPLDINISDVIVKLRGQRTGMVQTAEQYEFTYKAIYDGIQFLLHPEMKPPAPPLEEVSKDKEKGNTDNELKTAEHEEKKKRKTKEDEKSSNDKEESLSMLKGSQDPPQDEVSDISTSVEKPHEPEIDSKNSKKEKK